MDIISHCQSETYFVKVKVKLRRCLTKYHAMMTYPVLN